MNMSFCNYMLFAATFDGTIVQTTYSGKSYMKMSGNLFLSYIFHKMFQYNADSVDDADCRIDVVLIGPQVAHKIDEVKELLNNDKIPVAVMDKTDYGQCNGSAILKFAEELYAKKKGFDKKGGKKSVDKIRR